MKKHKITVVSIIVLLAALGHRSDGQQRATVEQQLRIAALMPKGASVYVQSRDLSALMRKWLASPQRAKFYKSASYNAFTRSRIYLKLADRIKDFETAIGVGLDESRLAELAGGASAVAIYEIGNTELVLLTELPRERAIVTTLFKQAPKFQERTAESENYYLAEVTTDAGRLKQQFCFAHVSGKLIVTTTEGLMLRVLRNAKQQQTADSLLPDVLATASQATGFTAGDLTLWLDQVRLNEALYFRSYWVHENTPQLAWMQNGIAGLTFSPEGMREQRWFSAKPGSQAAGRTDAIPADTANAMLGIVPDDAQLIRLYSDSTGSDLGASAENALLGTLRTVAPAVESAPDQTSSSSEGGSLRKERYSRLDSRFDRDVDDEVPDARSTAAARPQETSFVKTLNSLLGSVSGGAYCEAARSRNDAERLFVEFDRAVVLLLKENASLDRAALERATLDELRVRFAVAGVDPKLEWREEGGVRYVSQPLVRQNAAYAVSGRYLVLGSTREFVADSMKRAATPPARVIDGPVQYVALVRVAAAKPVFDRLVGVLDGKVASTATSDEEKEVRFFSENLSSLIDALAIREMRVRQTREGSGLREEVWYGW